MVEDYFKEVFNSYYNKIYNIDLMIEELELQSKKVINKNIYIYYYTLNKGSINLNYKLIVNKKNKKAKIIEQLRHITKIYRFKNKKFHSRKNKPAIITKNSNKEILNMYYYNNGKLHNFGYPAIQGKNIEEYWIFGKKYNKERALKIFNAQKNLKSF